MARTAKIKPPETKRKSEIVTVRLDPKLKYLAEMAARRQRRPLSSFIEWAVEQSLFQVYPAHDPSPSSEPVSFMDMANTLWDVDVPDRFAKLALQYPDLLDHEEQRLWKLIRECGFLWKGSHKGPNKEWQWKVSEGALIIERLRDNWETFEKIASSELDPSSLPRRVKEDNIPSTTSDFDKEDNIPSTTSDFDDEIPF